MLPPEHTQSELLKYNLYELLINIRSYTGADEKVADAIDLSVKKEKTEKKEE
jgi:hypothetical protein